jgi:hypothetical protein
VKFDLVPLRDLDDEQVDAWRDLAARAVQPNPLFEPECLVPAALHLTEGESMALVTASEDGAWHGCFPVQPARSWRSVRRPVFTTQVRRMIYEATPLVDGVRAEESLTCMLGGLRDVARRDRPGLLVLDWLDEGPVAARLQEGCRTAGVVHRAFDAWQRPMLYRRGDLSLREHHTKKFLHNASRLRRRLAEAEGAEVRLVDRSDDPAAVGILLGLEAGGYKGRNGVATVHHRGETEWFEAMCDGFRARGRLHLHTLDVGDRPIAAQLLVRAGDGLFMLKVAYDEAYAAYSPGVQLHLDAVGHLYSVTDAGWVDSCTYRGNETMLRLYPDRRAVTTVVLATGGAADRLTLRGVSAARVALGRRRRAERIPPLPASGLAS